MQDIFIAVLEERIRFFLVFKSEYDIMKEISG